MVFLFTTLIDAPGTGATCDVAFTFELRMDERGRFYAAAIAIFTILRGACRCARRTIRR